MASMSVLMVGSRFVGNGRIEDLDDEFVTRADGTGRRCRRQGRAFLPPSPLGTPGQSGRRFGPGRAKYPRGLGLGSKVPIEPKGGSQSQTMSNSCSRSGLKGKSRYPEPG